MFFLPKHKFIGSSSYICQRYIHTKSCLFHVVMLKGIQYPFVSTNIKMPFYRNAHIHLHIRLIFGNQVNRKLLFPHRLRQQHKNIQITHSRSIFWFRLSCYLFWLNKRNHNLSEMKKLKEKTTGNHT